MVIICRYPLILVGLCGRFAHRPGPHNNGGFHLVSPIGIDTGHHDKARIQFCGRERLPSRHKICLDTALIKDSPTDLSIAVQHSHLKLDVRYI